MTFLFDPAKGMEALRALEAQWGGTAQERLERRYAAYAAARGASITRPPRRDEDIFNQVEAEARLAAQQAEAIAEEVIVPRPEADPSGAPRSDALEARAASRGPASPPVGNSGTTRGGPR
jgi:penicillin-binding protein 2